MYFTVMRTITQFQFKCIFKLIKYYKIYVRMYLYNRMHVVFIKMSVYCFVVAPPPHPPPFLSSCGMYRICGRMCVCVSNNNLFKLQFKCEACNEY